MADFYCNTLQLRDEDKKCKTAREAEERVKDLAIIWRYKDDREIKARTWKSYSATLCLRTLCRLTQAGAATVLAYVGVIINTITTNIGIYYD
jgi:hypothetical protein